MKVSPAVQHRITRFYYQMLSRIDTHAVMPFMNYGYADIDPGAPPLVLDEADIVHRYWIQLYHHVASAVELDGRQVLEVGCGRGGGTAYIARYLRPKTLIGVDFADRAIRFCANQYLLDGVTFLGGEADTLPFAEHSFDSVINVESSHSYTSMEQFIGEVYRVLRPGGYFLYADFRRVVMIDRLRQQLTNGGFILLAERMITPNVVRALDLDNDRKLDLIQRHVPRLLTKSFMRFAAIRGTELYEGFRTGQLDYRSFVLQKPSSARPILVSGHNLIEQSNLSH